MGSAARTLDATNNRLTSLPTYLSSLTSLQRLIVASNQLTALPNDISALKSLKVLRFTMPCWAPAFARAMHALVGFLCIGWYHLSNVLFDWSRF